MDNGSELNYRIARLEEELANVRKRELELSDFIENAAPGLHRVGADGTILWANQAELDLLGFTREEYVGHHIAEFHADSHTIEDILRRLQNRETLNNYESRLRCKDGSIRDVIISSNVLWDGDRFVHTRCYTRDITESKHAERELREAHQMLRALVDSSPLPVIVFNRDGNITLWNPAAERMFGWRADEVLGSPLPFIPESKREEHRAMRAQDLAGQGLADREVRRRTRDGRFIDVRVSTAPLRDESGAVTAIMSVYVDITDRKRNERRLLTQYGIARILAGTSSFEDAAAKVLSIICENMDWGAGLLWTMQRDGRTLGCAAVWQQPSEANTAIEGARFEEFCRAQRFEPGVGLPGRIWASGQPAWIVDISLDPNFPRLSAALQRGWQSAFGFPIFLAGSLFGVMEFFTGELRASDEALLRSASTLGHQIGEILERQQAQKSVAESEENYRALTEAASDGIISIDETSRIQFANTALEKICGYTQEELLGSELTMLMPEHLRDSHRTGLRRYLDTGKRNIPWHAVQLPGRHKDGREISLEISFADSRKDGKHAFIGVIRDVTERKRFEERVRQTAKLESLGLLAGGIAHDFNNLLTGILGNISLVQEMLPDTHQGKLALKDAEEASERAAHLTKQLLAYAGKGRFVIEAIDLSNITREISALVKPAISKRVQLRLDLVEKLPCFEGDATQIQQLIMNLVINGAEAIGKERDGTVLVSTAVQDVDRDYIAQTFHENEIAPGKYVCLEVHDTGCGMDEGTLAQIFDPFFTTKFTGRGLGLAAAVGIVRGHKGALKVYSTPGKGSTFKVLFPAVDGNAPEKTKCRPRTDFVGKGKVLVVDDEEVVRKVAKTMLERYGYDVVVAENGMEAIEIFEQLSKQIVLVVLDLTMPVMNGEEALRQIKVTNPNVPVLLTSGFNEMEAIQRFAGKGLAGFVQKPYSSARLVEKLKAVLG